MFGFTIIRTDELKQERAKNLQAIKELNEKVEKDYEELKKKGEELDAFISQQASVFFEQNEKQRDIELRKWSVEVGLNHPYRQYWNAELLYRYVSTGDTSSIADYDSYYEWVEMKKEKAKASQSHLEAQ